MSVMLEAKKYGLDEAYKEEKTRGQVEVFTKTLPETFKDAALRRYVMSPNPKKIDGFQGYTISVYVRSLGEELRLYTNKHDFEQHIFLPPQEDRSLFIPTYHLQTKGLYSIIVINDQQYLARWYVPQTPQHSKYPF
jgi:hypothetical protein